MIFVRTLSLLLLLSAGVCFVAYIKTAKLIWRKRGLQLLMAFIVTALIFFSVLIAERVYY
jgi:hypothetical protein